MKNKEVKVIKNTPKPNSMKNKKNKKNSDVEQFKKDFCKLLAKYPDISVAENFYGNLIAYSDVCESVCIPSFHRGGSEFLPFHQLEES